MKQIAGVWLPAGEEHLVPFLEDRSKWLDGTGTYQRHKLERALNWVTGWRTAVDVGAHVGLWSMQLVERFALVEAFEPLAAHRDCFIKNLPMEQVVLHACAVGAEPGSVKLRSAAASSGDSWIDGAGPIPLRRLDDVLAEVDNVDFIKLDCEGYELFALQGGEALLRRCRPCVIVEQKPGRAQKYGLPETAAVDYLIALGATLRDQLSGDYILSW